MGAVKFGQYGSVRQAISARIVVTAFRCTSCAQSKYYVDIVQYNQDASSPWCVMVRDVIMCP